MKRTDLPRRSEAKAGIEALLRDHVRGVHDELANLFRGIERALDQHLERTESMIANAFASERDELESRLIDIERRLAQLETGIAER